MTFEQLKAFLMDETGGGQMYLPLLIKCLLEADGTSTVRQLAVNCLSKRNESQIIDCEIHLKETVLKVLANYDVVQRTGEYVSLNIQSLTLMQKAELQQLCEVLMQDNIVSRGLGTSDYCLSDNEPIYDSSHYKKEGCPFCELKITKDYILENKYAFVKLDIKPVTEGHSLIIPKRHFHDYFDILDVERDAVNNLIQLRRKQLLASDQTIEGFNIGINCGKVAGQTILHCHFHLIPRRKEDTDILREGIRGVISQKLARRTY